VRRRYDLGKEVARMARAIGNGVVIAESDKYELVEGSACFPSQSVKTEYLRDSGTDYECPWKGHADHYNIVVADKINRDAAWSYLDPKPAAKQIKEHVAFERRKGIQIEL
jgi:uncharacterized protein (DUF427 family)